MTDFFSQFTHPKKMSRPVASLVFALMAASEVYTSTQGAIPAAIAAGVSATLPYVMPLDPDEAEKRRKPEPHI